MNQVGEGGRVIDVRDVRWRLGPEEIGIGRFKELSNDGLRLVLSDLIENRLGQRDRIGAIQWNDEVRDIGSQDYLRRFWIKPPIELGVIEISITGCIIWPAMVTSFLIRGTMVGSLRMASAKLVGGAISRIVTSCG